MTIVLLSIHTNRALLKILSPYYFSISFNICHSKNKKKKRLRKDGFDQKDAGRNDVCILMIGKRI